MTVKLWGVDRLHLRCDYHSEPIQYFFSFLFKMLFIFYLWNLPTFKCLKKECMKPAGTRRLCNVRLTLDMTSDRHCILVENENRVDVNIWRWLNVGFWLHDLKTTKSQRQLTSVLDINLTLTLDVEFTLNFGHPTSQMKFNQISTSYDVVCLLCAC